MNEVLRTRKRKDRSENISERPLLEKRLEQLLQDPEFDKGDILYSRRLRRHVLGIVDWMNDNVKDIEPCDVFADDDTWMLDSCDVDDVRTLYDMARDVVSSNDDDNDVLSEDTDDDDIKVLRKWFGLLADCRKGLRAYEEEHGTSWHSICPGKVYEHSTLLEPLKRVFGPVLYGIQQGKKAAYTDSDDIDVVSFLGGVLVTQTGEPFYLRPDTFRGKYVFVCCINAPVLFESDGFQFLLNLCKELSSERDDIQIVMVAKMNILADTREVFDHLFSGFPSSCLAVPYERRDVRRLIGGTLSRGVNLLPRCLVFDTKGMCLESFYANDHRGFPYGASKFPFGAEAFPFTKDMVQNVSNFRVRLRKERITDLLRPYACSLDTVVHEFSATADGPQKKSSQLIWKVAKGKHVGLYVCCEGDLIPLLRDLYEQCKLKRMDFEIVVLYLPLLSGMDPDKFVEMIDDLLQKDEVCGWWCLPFNNSVSLRFWGLTKDYYTGDSHCHEDLEDKLIIVGPDGMISDMYGGEVIKSDDGFDAYPFTRAAVVKNRMRQMRDVKLESLVADQYLFRGDDPSDVISADRLLSSKKKIIIFLGRLNKHRANGLRYDFHGLVSQYEEMKKKGDEFEVVFIDYNNPRIARGDVDARQFGAMPWYICCPPDGTYTSLAKKLRKLVVVQSLVGFGEDGRICSVKQLEELDQSDTAGLCLEETLFDDLNHYYGFDEFRDI